MADHVVTPDESTAAFLAGLAAEQDAADDSARADADAAKVRLDSAWGVGYSTWTIAGPPPAEPPPVVPTLTAGK